MATRWIALAALVMLVGCDANVATSSSSNNQASAGPPPPPGAPAPPMANENAAATSAAGVSNAAPAPSSAYASGGSLSGSALAGGAGIVLPSGERVTPSISADAGNELIVAQKGVAKRGRSLDDSEGMIVTPIKSLFAVQERAIFEIQLPQALALYKASTGKAPQSHEEFMDKVVNFNQIKLPDLPPGHRYRYDPEIGQLLVERPKAMQ